MKKIHFFGFSYLFNDWFNVFFTTHIKTRTPHQAGGEFKSYQTNMKIQGSIIYAHSFFTR